MTATEPERLVPFCPGCGKPYSLVVGLPACITFDPLAISLAVDVSEVHDYDIIDITCGCSDPKPRSPEALAYVERAAHWLAALNTSRGRVPVPTGGFPEVER